MPLTLVPVGRDGAENMTEKTLTLADVSEDPSLRSLLEAWLQHPADELAPLTVRRYRGAVAHFLAWYEEVDGHAPTRGDLHPITLADYRGALQDASATSTVNTHLAALRAWCAWLHERGYLPGNPAARLKLVGRQEPPAPRALKPAQVNALLRQAQRTRYPARNTAIVQMLLQTGMRIGECAALRWEDIGYREKSGQVRIRAGKGNRARAVPLNDSARQALADYAAAPLGVAATPRAVAAAWPRPAGRTAPLWTSERGCQLSVREMGRMVHDLVRSCAARGLAPAEAAPHSLRHTFATRYLAAHRDDLIGQARLLGHTSLDATKIYVRPTDEELAARVERIDLNAYGG